MRLDPHWNMEVEEAKKRPVLAPLKLNDLTADWDFTYVALDYLLTGWTKEHVFVAADLVKGFYGLKIHPDHQRYFGVVIEILGRKRHFAYQRVPFGWKLSPVCFCVLTGALREVIEKRALAIGQEVLRVPATDRQTWSAPGSTSMT